MKEFEARMKFPQYSQFPRYELVSMGLVSPISSLNLNNANGCKL